MLLEKWNEHLDAFRYQLQNNKDFTGELRTDPVTRLLFSTDASIYQIEPLGVLFPRNSIDLQIAVETAAAINLPVLARGSGSSLAGQAIGEALILDCSRYFNHCIDINPDEMYADVEPGLILSTLNRMAGRYGLQFGPDPASAERATLGGCLANNATGAHSIIYGMSSDHLLSAEVVLSDGSLASFSETSIQAAEIISNSSAGITAAIYQAALHVRGQYSRLIQETFPQTWRRVSGYNLNYLLPWSPTRPPLWDEQVESWSGESLPYPPISHGSINLASLLAGSEGTLAVIKQARLRLVPRPKVTILGVLPYPSIPEACDAVPELLRYGPSAIELIPKNLVSLARSVPAYALQLSFVSQLTPDGSDPEALLVVEFSGNDLKEVKKKASALGPGIFLAETVEAQKRVWAVRKVGLGILMSRPGSKKPISFIEDIAVPVEKLGYFIREMEKLLVAYNTQAEIYAHASAGCLHIRPILNLKDSTGVADLRAIAERSIDLALSLGGAVTAEHGDGIARGEWIKKAYGTEMNQLFSALKFAADPKNILNPGKIISPQPMDTNLRYGPAYHAEGWKPVLNFPLGIADAVELCNGAGVCRKSEGVMCPSFQASQEEMHSTRGRANLLRSLMSGHFESYQAGEKAVKEALDLCLACKGCKSECPSAVDMAKLKYEFFHMFYTTGGRHHPARDYVFGYIHLLGRLGYLARPVSRLVMNSSFFRKAADRLLGISDRRALPTITGRSLSRTWKGMWSASELKESNRRVLFLADGFGEYFQPESSIAAMEILKRLNHQVMLLPVLGAGRTLISKDFLDAARLHARKVIQAIQDADPEGKLPIIGVEPSEIHTMRDEYLDMFPEMPAGKALARRAWTIEEFLSRPDVDGKIRWEKLNFSNDKNQKVLFHAHCYQRASPPADDGYPVGVEASVGVLKASGYQVDVIDDGCCGVAGAFGYEKEHYDFSVKVGELALLPAIREAMRKDPETLLSASGVSCQAQIEHGARVHAYHPVELVVRNLAEQPISA